MDDLLQVVEGAGDPSGALGLVGTQRALQRQPDGEQALDHVVVQVAGNAVAVGQHVQLPHPALGSGQVKRQPSLGCVRPPPCPVHFR